MGTKNSSPGVQRRGRQADRSLPSGTEVKNSWSYNSSPQYAFMKWCLFKTRSSYPKIHGQFSCDYPTSPVILHLEEKERNTFYFMTFVPDYRLLWHKYTHTHTHTWDAYIRQNLARCMHTYIHTYIIHTYTHTHIYVYFLWYTCWNDDICKNAYQPSENLLCLSYEVDPFCSRWFGD
jgi:hypothetical protein